MQVRVCGGVHEYQVNYGQRDREYFGNSGERLVIALAGGNKKRQDADIRSAKKYWQVLRMDFGLDLLLIISDIPLIGNGKTPH